MPYDIVLTRFSAAVLAWHGILLTDAAPGDGGAEVKDDDRVVWDSRRRGTTPAGAGGIAEKGSDRPRRRCALKLASRISALL